MSTKAVCECLIRVALHRRVAVNAIQAHKCLRGSTRTFAATAQMSAKPKDEELPDEPIKFSTSKGSHRTWKVKSSLGAQSQRPLWKVLPVSLFCIGFLLWCTFREETEIDKLLEQQLNLQTPASPPDETSEK